MAKKFTPKLSPRLEGIVELVPEGSRVADIGCDHGYISIALVQRNLAVHSIASDIKSGPLEQAVKNIAKAELTDKIETRLAPGITAIKSGEADVIVIAGMGQRTIAEILTENMDIAKEAKYLILQPQSELADMRRFLLGNGFKLIKNKLMIEGDKYYIAMVASATEDTYPGMDVNIAETFRKRFEAMADTPEIASVYETMDLLFGWDLIYTDPQLAYFLNHVEHEWTEALSKLGEAKNPDYDRIKELNSKVEAARLALEINTTFCGVDRKLFETLGSEAIFD
ncbi:MAG: class I SAM-dependent methyltransferase [Lachnospiraceae bacterium]|nr:class I SAM-dependent methyltransferase [Lachnospiraceae bacterium]